MTRTAGAYRMAMAFLVLAVAWICPAAAHGQATDELALAEQAYLRVDFPATLEHAAAALEAGGRGREQLVRVYQLIGIAAAALEDEDRSREAYVHMLAIDPDRDVDRNLAPRLRSPFLEARGYWTARSGRLRAEVSLDRGRGGIVVSLEDPLQMARAVVVHVRLPGDRTWRESTQPALASQLVPVEGVADVGRVEYAVEVLDPHGNHLIELGSTASPRVLADAAVTATGERAPEDEGGSILASPLFWVVAGAVLVGGGIAVWLLAADQAAGTQTAVTIGFE